MNHDWIAQADREDDRRLIGQDEDDTLWAPVPRRYSRLEPSWVPLNMRNPSHWPAYLRSILSNRVAHLTRY